MVLCFLWCPELSCNDSFFFSTYFFLCVLTGGSDQETDKPGKVEPNTFPNVSVAKPTIDARQKAVEVAPKANRPSRFKRRANGIGKLAGGQWGELKKAEA